MAVDRSQPWGYRWRSSRTLIVATVCVALFTETLLYGFLVPILSYMLETRLHIDPSQTLRFTTALLGLHGFVALVSAPIVAHLADKTPNRKIPLIATLVGCLAGTLLLACTPSVWALFVGRVLQGAAGSAAWIVCLAMLTDNVPAEHTGKMMGLTMSCVTAGLISGPFIAGAVLESLGYWAAWSVPLAALLLDVIARLIIIESRENRVSPPADIATTTSTTSGSPTEPSQDHDTEASPLLPSTSTSDDPVLPTDSTPIDTAKETPDTGNFYGIMLRDIRVITGLTNVVLISAVTSGFNTTLPLHLTRTFHWGTASVGMVFFAMQVPAIALGPAVGWLRDRVGLRVPTAAGWTLLAPLLWLLGVPGARQFPWASPEDSGEAILISAAVAIGVVLPLVRGAGMLKVIVVLNEIQAKSPGIFGAHGGSNRAFSMQEVCFSFGLIVGPVVSGLLSETVGYYYMNVTFAVMCLLMSLCCYRLF